MGAYGGTLEASRSYFGEPVCENQLAGDINGDCKVDQADMGILLSHWLMEATVPTNIPPTVTLTRPEDGAEFTYPEPIILRADVSDPDGSVLFVTYSAEHHGSDAISHFGTHSLDPANGWEGQFDWSSIRGDGTCTIRAEAVDNGGGTTVSPAITVTLHPSE
jgi:hypothetical protein